MKRVSGSSWRLAILTIGLTGVTFARALPQEASHTPPQEPSMPRATMHFDKTTYASADEVDASVVIYNPGPNASAVSLPDVRITITGDDGKALVNQPLLVYSGHGPMKVERPIQPGASFSVKVPVKLCEVSSDPCGLRVSASVEVVTPAGPVRIVTPDVAITVVRDPSATFRGGDLRNNRPLFIAQSSADSVFPTSLTEMVLTTSGRQQNEPDPSGTAAITQALRRSGLRPSGISVEGNPSEERMVIQLAEPVSAVDLQAALRDVENALGPRVISGSIRYAASSFDLRGVFVRAQANATADVRRLSDLIGAGAVERTYSTASTSRQELRISQGQNSQAKSFFADGFLFSNAGDDAISSDKPTTINVRANSSFQYVGSQEATGPSPLLTAPVRELEELGPAARGLAWEPAVATVDSDRPEIFAIDQTTNGRANAAGYRPDALATLLATRRARAIAQYFHVSPGPVTLVVAYPSNITSWDGSPQDSDVVAAGVAVGPSGDLDASWRRLLPTPTPIPNPAPGGTPRALAMPMVIPTPSPPPTPSPVRPYGSVRIVDVLPIAVPDERTRLVVTGDVPESGQPDRLRVSFAVRPNASPDPALIPEPSTVERMLRADPSVEDVAVNPINGVDPLPIGYQVIIKVADRASTERLSAQIAALYHLPKANVVWSAAPVLSDCSALAFNAQKHSLDEALHAAIKALWPRQQLRHLVLVAALPAASTENDVCDAHAHGDALERSSKPDDSSEAITVSAPVELVFRIR